MTRPLSNVEEKRRFEPGLARAIAEEWASRRGDVFKLIEEFLHRGGAVLDGRQFGFIERDLLTHPQQIRAPLDCHAASRLLGHINPALCTCHAMRALIEEIVGTEAVAEIVIAPGLGYRAAGDHGLPVDENLDGPRVSRKVPRVAIGRRQLRRADVQVVLSGGSPSVAEPSLQFK